MKLIIGLGNPGTKYQNNRHNVGFMVIDKVVRELMVSPHLEKKRDSTVFYHHASGTVFAKPQTFMNQSGQAVSKLVNWNKVDPDDLYVIHDDLDLPLGQFKIQKGKGPKLHNGIKSIEDAFGSQDFWRVRIGVDNRTLKNRIAGEQYVLQDFTDEERKTISGVIDKVKEELKSNAY